jgi:hypothetical protein
MRFWKNSEILDKRQTNHKGKIGFGIADDHEAAIVRRRNFRLARLREEFGWDWKKMVGTRRLDWVLTERTV